MRRASVLLGLVALLAIAGTAALAQGGTQGHYGGFDIIVNHIAPGEGTFDIYGSSDYGTVDVSGSFKVDIDRETRTFSVRVVFDEGSYVSTADGEYIDLGGKEFTYGGELGRVRIIPNLINWLKSLLEG